MLVILFEAAAPAEPARNLKSSGAYVFLLSHRIVVALKIRKPNAARTLWA